MEEYLNEVIRAYGFVAPTSRSRFSASSDADEAIIQRLEPQPERREQKRQLALLLAEASGRSMPWGALTGVRPTTILREWQQACDASDEALAGALATYYGIHPHQSMLGLRTARTEAAIEAELRPGGLLLYLSLPFCASRCRYCSFVPPDGIAASRATQEAYVEAMLYELRALWPVAAAGRSAAKSSDNSDMAGAQASPDAPATSASPESPATPALLPEAVYIGGGTPSSLPPDLFDHLMTELEALPGWSLIPEITLEAGRVDSLDDSMLEVISRHRFTGICLNPQSLDPKVLQAAGRPHDREALERVYGKLRAMGLPIHMDLIFGLEEETAEGFMRGLRELIAWDPAAITIHPLARKKGAELTELHSPLRPQLLAQAQNELMDEGYEPYYLYRHKYAIGNLENCSFAKPGMATRYNVAMMNDRHPVLAVGACGMSKAYRPGERVKRYPNRRTVESYLELKEEERPSKGQRAVVEGWVAFVTGEEGARNEAEQRGEEGTAHE